MNANNIGEEDVLPLFETKAAKGRTAYRLFCSTIFVGMVLILVYRYSYIPKTGQPGRYAWIGMLFAEVLFGLYWILTQAGRWQVVYRYPFKDRLCIRYTENLPGVDIFVCTADPTLEPPSLVMNTVLSVMSYNYKPEKLAVYLSDDGCSELTFYALLEASEFSRYWIPFCKNYNVEPRAPEIYFAQNIDLQDSSFAQEWTKIKKLYEDMKSRIDSAAAKGGVPEEIKDKHKGFSEWNSKITKQDHQSIVQILVDGWNPHSFDIEGNRLPTLVYLSREKRPGFAHNFKAGSMNSLIRVSSEITNAPIILNLDCDMYSNDPDAILDSLCFFLDEKQGQRISYVQYPQRYNNITKNDIYANVSCAIFQIELAGIDGFGGALYIGTGCFHRRESLLGKKYYKDHRVEWNDIKDNIKGRMVEELEVASKPLANCSYEQGTLWGKEMGLVYGCPVEDIVTGLTIQCRGWRPVYYNPRKSAFLGLAPTTLDVALVQFKRWAEGMFQIFFSKYCPFIYGRGKIKLGAQMGYCIYLLWAPVSLPTLYYVAIPALYLLHGVPLFPRVSSLWFVPFAYVFAAKIAYSLVEDIMCGDTLRGWWNLQRMWLIRRVAPYFFAFIDTISRMFGLSETSFAVTAKVVDDDVQKRYEKEIIEFGSSSIMYLIIAMLSLLNLFSLGYGIKNVVFSGPEPLDKFLGQIIVSWLVVMVSLPIYEALFFRRDKGSIPSLILFKSIVIASVVCLIPVY
ncbi:Cellulose synthase (UDP-forming) [Handroanthus impetiginosus]|uniref:Cellulose synthase (UDP-forming) n=1 Tax=Handroanthus impetiginosus TaxID=429701 RepID=A0A2G9GW98_9LAMI|nr:Cellulose synthase (UDP-forming) [Handroanthus impetiginosus]